MFPSLMRPKPPRRIAQDTFFHQAGILFGNPVLRSLFGSLGHQFHIYGIVAAFHLLRVEEYDRQIQFAGKAFGAGQDGGILVQEVRPVVQVVPARCLVGDKITTQRVLSFFRVMTSRTVSCFLIPKEPNFVRRLKNRRSNAWLLRGRYIW